VQEAWLRILDKPGQLLGESLGTLGTWLLTVAGNVLLDRQKAASNRLEISHILQQASHDGRHENLFESIADDVDVAQAVAENLDDHALVEIVENILGEFDDTTASLLRATLSGKPLADVASKLGLAYEAAKKRVQRGRKSLADRLTARLDERGALGGGN